MLDIRSIPVQKRDLLGPLHLQVLLPTHHYEWGCGSCLRLSVLTLIIIRDRYGPPPARDGPFCPLNRGVYLFSATFAVTVITVVLLATVGLGGIRYDSTCIFNKTKLKEELSRMSNATDILAVVFPIIVTGTVLGKRAA